MMSLAGVLQRVLYKKYLNYYGEKKCDKMIAFLSIQVEAYKKLGWESLLADANTKKWHWETKKRIYC